MVAHFPSLYPDELLYSGIARYHQISGNTAQKQTIKELFGDRLVCATVDLPSHLRHLSERLGSVYTVEDLIMRHTLYPYYSAFLPQEKAQTIFKLMSEGAPWGEVHIVLGIPASLIKLPTHLKYCRSCYASDISDYHEPYWHSSHQIPGVFVCPRHKVPLENSNVSYTTREKKFEFSLLSNVGTADTSSSIQINSDLLNHFVMVAEQSSQLQQVDRANMDYFVEFKQSFHDKGYITEHGRIRFLKLMREFNEYFSPKFLKQLQCEVNERQFETWLHKMVRGNDLMFHPLRHILLASFLGITNFKQRSSEGTPINIFSQVQKAELITSSVKEREGDLRTAIKDWDERDRVTLIEVQHAVFALKRQTLKPQRITISAVSRSLNRSKVPFVLEKCLNKLPETKLFLDRVCETTEQFQIRRLGCATTRLANRSIRIQGWRLLKEAGLNVPLREPVEMYYKMIMTG
ncbi:TnsD family Tn7-like transposition protein [Paenibacillus mesotrionivorans]|uniref:TnsD family Tn7-like transposition protein n=1 Tax=Paenibacillus mesotrionivorans TaxID=3160968 RepID=A0ACC7NXB1_9BACL